MSSSPLSTDKELVKALGVETLMDAFEYSEHRVKKWMQRGIPWKDRNRVAKLASAKRVRLPAGFLQERRPA